jgi:putative ABC transport system permease protein
VRGWGLALRMARRSVRRNLKRSILIAALIAVPIAGATVIDGLLRTLSGEEHNLYRTLGDSDGIATITDRESLGDWRPGMVPPSSEGEAPADDVRDPATVDLLGMLPVGSRAVAGPVYGDLRLRDGDRIVRTELDLLAVGDPLVAHRGRLAAGRLPAGPSEALVTESLAERLGLLDGDGVRRGSTITADDGPTVTVTGVAVNPQMLDQQAVFAPQGSVLAGGTLSSEYSPPEYYVDLPANVDVDDVWPVLAEHGVQLLPRQLYTDPARYGAPWQTGGDLLETAGAVALVVGFGLLEVVLLAGAAFAVGARRQVRELGLVGANGGTAGHVRRIVLAQGLFLGLVGALAGLVFGWVVLVAGTPLWERVSNELIEGWRLGWIELTVAAMVGVLSGLAAALLPAIGVARMRPVDALAQRFRSTARRTRLPVLGVVLLGVGIGIVLGSGVLARQAVRDYLAILETTADEAASFPSPDLTLPTVGILLGGFAAVGGVIMVTPGLVGALGRLGWRLPLSGRLAVRDAGRHRHRTVPAIVAIMIVVTGSVTTAFSLASTTGEDYRTVPDNTILVNQGLEAGDAEANAEQFRDGVAEVAAELPGATIHEVRMAEDPKGAPDGPALVSLGPTGETTYACQYRWAQVEIGSPELIELFTGERPSAAALSALDEGKVLVSDECLVSDDTVTVAPFNPDEPEAEPVSLPAWQLSDDDTFYDTPAFISEEAARAHGWTSRLASYAVSHADTASQDEVDAALTAAEDNGLNWSVETDESAEVNLATLGIAAGAGLVTLLGVGITVALSAAEGRADLATLAAIGAQPRRRRMLAGAQALVLSGMGTVLGLLLGGVLGFAIGPIGKEAEFVLPWEHLAITAVAVPLLAVLIAMLSTRSTLPMVRRVD